MRPDLEVGRQSDADVGGGLKLTAASVADSKFLPALAASPSEEGQI